VPPQKKKKEDALLKEAGQLGARKICRGRAENDRTGGPGKKKNRAQSLLLRGAMPAFQGERGGSYGRASTLSEDEIRQKVVNRGFLSF